MAGGAPWDRFQALPVRTRGRALVAMQFSLLGFIALMNLVSWTWRATIPLALVLIALGVAVGAWALWSNRPGNFNIVPDPRQGAQLVQHGAYRWMRHPMYTALMIGAAGLVAASGSFWAGVAWIVLVGVLGNKAELEEALMSEAHADYAAYAERTRRFLPGIV